MLSKDLPGSGVKGYLFLYTLRISGLQKWDLGAGGSRQAFSLLLVNIVQDFSWLLEGSSHWQECSAECSGLLPITNLHLSLICKVVLIFQIDVLKLQDVPCIRREIAEGHLFPLSCYSRGDYFYLFLSKLCFPAVPVVPRYAVTWVHCCKSQVTQELSIASHKQNELFPTLYLAVECWMERKMLFYSRKWWTFLYAL